MVVIWLLTLTLGFLFFCTRFGFGFGSGFETGLDFGFGFSTGFGFRLGHNLGRRIFLTGLRFGLETNSFPDCCLMSGCECFSFIRPPIASLPRSWRSRHLERRELCALQRQDTRVLCMALSNRKPNRNPSNTIHPSDAVEG